MIFFDSNILIYFIENNNEFGETAAQAISYGSRKCNALFSVLAITELTARPLTHGQEDKLLLLSDKVDFVDFNSKMASLAGKLRQSSPAITTPDAIHLATALSYRAKLFVTNDLPLTKIILPGLEIVSLNNFVKSRN